MTNSIEDIGEADAYLIIGSNTTETHPVISYRVKRARRRGAALIVADPRRIRLAEEADVFLQLKPGTNIALILGMARVILDEGLYDEGFVAARCEGFDKYKASLEGIRLEDMAQLTGVPAGDIAAAARLYASRKPAAILYAMGITQHSHGTDNVKALAGLAMMTGNLGIRGGGVNPLRGQNNVQGSCDMGALPNVYPGYQKVGDPEAAEKFAAAYKVTLPSENGIPMTEMFKKALTGEFHAVHIMGENPVMSEADSGKIRKALEAMEFVVVQDIFLNETGEFADVVLPSASFAEKEGTFVNTERRIQRVRKAVDPPGDAKTDLEILCTLARKMGFDTFEYDGPAQVMEEIASLVPRWAGVAYERLDGGGLSWPCPSREHPGTPILYTDGFLRENGKALFHPVSYKTSREQPDGEYPLVLTTGRSLYHYHTGTMTRRVDGLNIIHGEERVWLSEEDAVRLGVETGDEIRITSRRGSVTARALVVDEIGPGTVFMTFHFAEACANELTTPEMDPVTKTPEFKSCAVRVEKA